MTSQENYYTNLASELFTEWMLLGWKFKIVDSCGKSTTLGLCDYSRKTISLNRVFVNTCDYKSVVDTLKHEIAHAIVGRGNGHNARWKHYARMVGAIPLAKKNINSVSPELLSKSYKYRLGILNKDGTLMQYTKQYANRRTDMTNRYIRGFEGHRLQWFMNS